MNTTKNKYLSTLAPLRGIGAMFVLCAHIGNIGFNRFSHLIERTWLWVDFFFVLSGFIISYVYTKEFKDGLKWNKYRSFIRARFARIYPLHFFTLILAVIGAFIIRNLAVVLDERFKVIFDIERGVPASLLFVQSLHLFKTPPLNTASWTLSTEWWTYIIFPFLLPFFSRLKLSGKAIALFFIIALYLFLKYVLTSFSESTGGLATLEYTADFGFLRCLAGFLLGMLTYEFYKMDVGYKILKKSWAFIIAFGGFLLGLHWGITDLIVIGFFPFILLTAAYNNTAINKLFSLKPLQYLGELSFSIYMVQVPVIMFYSIYRLLKDPYFFSDYIKLISKPEYSPNSTESGLIIAVTLILAAFTYKYIEIPARKYINKELNSKNKKLFLKPV